MTHPPEPRLVEGSSTIEKEQTSNVHSQVAFLDARFAMKDAPSDLTTVSRGNYFRRVAMIGLQVADGLSYAHSQEVLHRDIKPSNLMLDTRGTVWITDFGLAKSEGSDDLTQPGDIVGTMRYMAPERFEGRADARSDLYSLGMTLYELLTLHPAFEDSNRARLIKRIAQEQPTWPRRLDPHTPRDLETIILKAIAKEPADRYQTAAEFAEDLKRFLADRPIKARRSSQVERTWRWCRRNPLVAGLIASVTLLLTTVAVVSSLAAFWLNQEKNATKNQLALTQRAEGEATRQLYNSLVAQARASRLTGRLGQRFDSLEALKKAAGLLPSLDLGPEAVRELRNEAIACMVLPDLRLVKTLDGDPQARGAWGTNFDDNLERYARSDAAGNISVRRVLDDQEIMNLPGPGEPAWLGGFSPNGQYLAAKYHHSNTPYANRCWVWDLEHQEKVFIAPSPVAGMGFSPDSRRLAIGFLDGTLKVYDLTLEKKEFIVLAQGPLPESFAFHPDGQKLAVIRNQRMEIWDLKTENVGQTSAIPVSVRGMVWHPEGKLWAAASDKDFAICVWNASRGQSQAELKGHQGGGVGCAFNHAGDVLVSNSWDGTIRLWDPWTGHQLLNSGQGGMQFSRDDRLMGGVSGLWEVALGWECRKLSASLEVGKGPWSVEFSSDGRLLASGHEDGVRFWDLSCWKEVGQLSLPPTPHTLTAIFHPDGRNLITAARNGLYCWEVLPHRQGDEEVLQIGPPRLLGDTARSEIWRASLSANGTIVALADRSRHQAIVLDMESKPNKILLRYSHPNIANIAISPDGRWVASAPWGDASGTVRVYEIPNQTHVKDFLEPNTSNSVRFSPDSQWLVIGNRLWQTGSWKAGPLIEGRQNGALPVPLAFSPDGKILASAAGGPSSQPVRLVEPSSGREFATLSVPNPEWILWLCFSPDGSQLAAACSGHGIRVWDLRLIRQQLADIGLDWDLPPYPPMKSPSPAKPLQVKVVLGNLAKLQPGHDPLPPASLKDQLALYSLAIAVAPLPLHPEPYHQRGHVYERLGQSRQAMEDFSAALLRQPADPKQQAHLHAVRARNHRHLGNYEQSIADFEEALKFDSEQSGTCNDLAWLYVTGPENLRNPTRALTLAKKANALRPKHWYFLNTLGVTYYRLGKYSEAVENLESSLRDSQAQAGAFDLFFLSMCHARLGDSAKATDCYDRAVKWVGEHQGQLSSEWAEELRNFRAEADAVLAKPAPARKTDSDNRSQG
jgi:WD40 repeat protein/Tfp pilus assembly protein PilF